MTTWAEIFPRDVVLGADGKEWTVVEKDTTGHVRLVRFDGREHEGTPTGNVTLVRKDPQKAEADTAVALVMVRLGGVVISKHGRDRTKPHLTPVEFDDPAALHAHLLIFHGVTDDAQDLASLTKRHGELHDPEEKAKGLYEDHVHDPDFDLR